MKLNIEVDLSEFYAENFNYDSDLGASPSSSISEEVAEIVRHEVRQAISKQIRDDVSRLASNAYNEFGEEKIKSIVEFKMDEFVKNGEVRARRGDGTVTVTERLREIFDGGSWNNADDAMKRVGKKFAEECRSRYDAAFATSVVTGLEKQGLLKPGVFKAIMSDNHEEE